jgi:hypothetical protein
MPIRLIAVLLLFAAPVLIAQAQDNYKLGPDSMEKDGVPKGDTWKFE